MYIKFKKNIFLKFHIRRVDCVIYYILTINLDYFKLSHFRYNADCFQS